MVVFNPKCSQSAPFCIYSSTIFWGGGGQSPDPPTAFGTIRVGMYVYYNKSHSVYGAVWTSEIILVVIRIWPFCGYLNHKTKNMIFILKSIWIKANIIPCYNFWCLLKTAIAHLVFERKTQKESSRCRKHLHICICLKQVATL